MEKTRIALEIGGQEFRITSTDSEEYIRSLASLVNRRIDDVKMHYPQLSANKCTLLAMLNLEDELQKLRVEYSELDKKISTLRELKHTAPVKRPFEHKTERSSDAKRPAGV